VAFRDSPLSALKTPLTWMAAAVAIVVAFAALALVLTDRPGRRDNPYGAARGEFDEVMEPIDSVIAAPVRWIGAAGDYIGGYFFAIRQNQELHAQIRDLQQWHDVAVAERNLNRRYESLLKLRTEPPIPMVTARVVSDVRGPFSDARLADAGSAQGVKVGNPAMSEDGVIGRVIGVTPNASRVLLLTDVESRTPVVIDRSNARAILTGDGGPNPRLDFVRGVDPVKEGDVVLTSGDGGLYPRGLPVGVAGRDYRGVWRVRLYSDRAGIDFVRILLFDDFSQSVNQGALAASASILPPLSKDEQAELDAARATAAKPPPPPPSVTAPTGVPTTGAPAAAGAPATAARAAQSVQVQTATSPTERAPKPASKPARTRPKIPKGAFTPDDASSHSATADPPGGGR
jgi:rod shape-determining protein MreC